jgi:hypothetical protein
MTRILLVGIEPDAVDYSDPALPPGMSAETIQAGIDLAMRKMSERGWQGEHCLVRPDATAAGTVTQRLAAAAYDCVVIGGGIRIPPGNLVLFEQILNAVHKAAPGTAIAFNTSPETSADAAARWVDGRGSER